MNAVVNLLVDINLMNWVVIIIYLGTVFDSGRFRGRNVGSSPWRGEMLSEKHVPKCACFPCSETSGEWLEQKSGFSDVWLQCGFCVILCLT